MKYSISFSDKADKQLKSLDKDLAQRIVKKLRALKENPCEKTLPLQNSEFRRLRAGNWRVIVDVAEDLKEVLVVMLGKRENIYKELEKSRG